MQSSDLDAWSRAAVARLSDAQWRRIQRARRWLKIGSLGCFILSIAAGVYLILEAEALREGILTDAAKMRAEAAEIRLAVEYRRCDAFPNECKLRQSVFYQRGRVQPEQRRTGR